MSRSPSDSNSDSDSEVNFLSLTGPLTWYIRIPLSPSYAHCSIILFDAICTALQEGCYQISSAPGTTPGFVIMVRGRHNESGAIWRAAYGIAQRRLEFWRMVREMHGSGAAGVVERGVGRLRIEDEG